MAFAEHPFGGGTKVPPATTLINYFLLPYMLDGRQLRVGRSFTPLMAASWRNGINILLTH